MPAQSRAELLLPIADDELILGWRNSEWTGIAPFLEEDVAFSSIAQNEIGHARALYDLVAEDLGTDADALAFERPAGEYRSSPLVELQLVPDWARTIARHVLYETADALRIASLIVSDDRAVAGLAAKIEREEVYHRMHAEMWADRLLESDAGRIRLQEAIRELWPFALGVLDEAQRGDFAGRVEAMLRIALPSVEPVERGEHGPELSEFLDEMTMVRRGTPLAQW